MVLKLKTENEFGNKDLEETLSGIGVFYEKDDTLDCGFNLTFNSLYSPTKDEVDEGVRLSKESLIILHGFLSSVLNIEK